MSIQITKNNIVWKMSRIVLAIVCLLFTLQTNISIYANNDDSTQLLWTKPYSSETITIKDSLLITQKSGVATFNDIYCFEIETGDQIFEEPIRTESYSKAIEYNNTIITTSNKQHDKSIDQICRFCDEVKISCYDIDNGMKLWESDRVFKISDWHDDNIISIVDGNIMLVENIGNYKTSKTNVVLLNPTTGKEITSKKIYSINSQNQSLDDIYSTSIMDNNNKYKVFRIWGETNDNTSAIINSLSLAVYDKNYDFIIEKINILAYWEEEYVNCLWNEYLIYPKIQYNSDTGISTVNICKYQIKTSQETTLFPHKAYTWPSYMYVYTDKLYFTESTREKNSFKLLSFDLNENKINHSEIFDYRIHTKSCFFVNEMLYCCLEKNGVFELVAINLETNGITIIDEIEIVAKHIYAKGDYVFYSDEKSSYCYSLNNSTRQLDIKIT
ncbi:MAG: PQQ-binding-like beta-propeller repeat protein, partial [Caldisericia bacterium]|nr:PQQ-binding-like beta-propeller repeat protein [Caldisericia bacterium]